MMNTSRFSGRSYSPAYHDGEEVMSRSMYGGRDTSMMSQDDLTQALVETDDVGALLAKVQLDHHKRLRWMVSDATGGRLGPASDVSRNTRSRSGLVAPTLGPNENPNPGRSLSAPMYPPAVDHPRGRLRSPALGQDEADVIAASYVTGTVQDDTVQSMVHLEQSAALASHLIHDTTTDTARPSHNTTANSRSVSLVSPPSEDEHDVTTATTGDPTEIVAALVGADTRTDANPRSKTNAGSRLAAPKRTPVKKSYTKSTASSVAHQDTTRGGSSKKKPSGRPALKYTTSGRPTPNKSNTSVQSVVSTKGATSMALRERQKNRKNWNVLKNTPIEPTYGDISGSSPGRGRFLDESGISVYESFFTRQPLGFRYDDEQGGLGEEEEPAVDEEEEPEDIAVGPESLQSRTSPRHTQQSSSIVEVFPPNGQTEGIVAARGVALAPDAYEPSSVFPVEVEAESVGQSTSLQPQHDDGASAINNRNYNRVADVPPVEASEVEQPNGGPENPLGSDVALPVPAALDTPRSDVQPASSHPPLQTATPPPAALIHHHRQGTGIDVEAADAFLNDTRTLPQEGDFFFEGSPGMVPNSSIAFQDPQPLSSNASSRRTSAQTAEPFVPPVTDPSSSSPLPQQAAASKQDTGSASEGTAGTGATAKPKKNPVLKKPLMAPKPSPKTASIRSKSANDIETTPTPALGPRRGSGGSKKQVLSPPSAVKGKKPAVEKTESKGKKKESTPKRPNSRPSAPVSFATPSSYAGSSSDEEEEDDESTDSTGSSGEYTYDYVSSDGDSSRGFSSEDEETEMTQTYRSNGNRGHRQLRPQNSSMKKQVVGNPQGTHPAKKTSFAPGVVFSHQDDADEFVQAEALVPTPSGHAAARGDVMTPPLNRPKSMRQQPQAITRSGGYGPAPNQHQRIMMVQQMNQSMNSSSRSITPGGTSSGVFKGSSFGGAGPSWRLGSPEKMRSASPTGVASGVFTQRSGVFQVPQSQADQSKTAPMLRRQTSLGGNVFPAREALLQQQREQAMRQQQQLERQQAILAQQQQQQRAMMASGMDPRQAAAMRERQLHEERLRKAKLAQQQQLAQMQQQQQQIMKMAMLQRQQQSMSQPQFSTQPPAPSLLPPQTPQISPTRSRSQPNFSTAEPQSPSSPSFQRPILSRKHERQLSNSGMVTPPPPVSLLPVPTGPQPNTSSQNSSQTSVVVHSLPQSGQTQQQQRPMIIRPQQSDQSAPPLPLQQADDQRSNGVFGNTAGGSRAPLPPPSTHHQPRAAGLSQQQTTGGGASRSAFPIDQVVQPTAAGGDFTLGGASGSSAVGSTSAGAVPIALVPPPKK